MNEFHYTLDQYAEEPIMLVSGVIGEDVLANQFCKELMFLDSLNKKHIQVWINSGGGDCQHGEQIFSTILKSKTQVDTYNIGTAASIAGPIFLAGKDRYMMRHAKFMMHPVSGGDLKAREAYEKSVNTMLSQRSVLSPEKAQELINATTWLTPDECKDLGICTEIEDIRALNLAKSPSSVPETIKNAYAQILNKVTDNNMNKVANFLNLNPASNNLEDAIITEVTKLRNEATAASDKLNKFMDEYNIAKKAKDEAETKFLDMETKYNKFLDEQNSANKLAAENSAKIDVENAAKLGKIENKAESLKTWTEKYVADPAGTKALLDSIPAKVEGADLNKIINSLGAPRTFTTADINNSLLKKQNSK